MSARSENHENKTFEGFPTLKFKNCSSKMKKNNPTELSGYAFLRTLISKGSWLMGHGRAMASEARIWGPRVPGLGYGTTPIGSRGGSRYVEGDSKI